LAKQSEKTSINNLRNEILLTGICFGRGGGASRMTIGSCSRGGGG